MCSFFISIGLLMVPVFRLPIIFAFSFFLLLAWLLIFDFQHFIVVYFEVYSYFILNMLQWSYLFVCCYFPAISPADSLDKFT